MIQRIDNYISVANRAIEWARDFGKDQFPFDTFRDYRRRLKKIRGAVEGNPSAAAYGESQVGKSYLMSSLLSAPDKPFMINSDGREYSFIDDVNPSGGNNAKVETTGVITRFRVLGPGEAPCPNVRATMLTMADVILLLADSFYNDVKIDSDVLTADDINARLTALAARWRDAPHCQDVICDDDIKDIVEYMRKVVGIKAQSVYNSRFEKVVAPMIGNIPREHWIDVFQLLWNCNPALTPLFNTLVDAYARIGFNRRVQIPFRAVRRDYGSLLRIAWLDEVCGVATENEPGFESVTPVFDDNGQLLASDFSKGELSALTSEITFELPADAAQERRFLEKIDLLDFPGARSRGNYEEEKIAEVLPQMLRRGKVAYLFNKYSRSWMISSVLFCHHNDQKSESTLGPTINDWIRQNIGKDPAERGRRLRDTGGVSPLFMVATKFNIDLTPTKNDTPANPATLDKHWNRFDTVIPEIITPDTWMERWSADDGRTVPFRGVYPLRDFYWSSKELFNGYADKAGVAKSPETSRKEVPGYPGYWDDLKRSFVNQPFVRAHFADPSAAWEGFASLNNDGSQAIIRDLDAIAGTLGEARDKEYTRQLDEIARDMHRSLSAYFEPDDPAERNRRIKLIARDIHRALDAAISREPGVFGRIIDGLMIAPEEPRNIAYDVIVCHIDTPRDFTAVNFIRAQAGVDLNLSREENTARLIDYYMADDEADLRRCLAEQELDLDMVLSGDVDSMGTIGDVVVKHLFDYWVEHLNRRCATLEGALPHADEVVMMFMTLFSRLGLRRELAAKINRYAEIFPEAEQPNAIGDLASLTFNNFITSVGRDWMKTADLDEVSSRAAAVGLNVDLSPRGIEARRRPQPLVETLEVFDRASQILNSPGAIDLAALSQLPFWNHYRRWKNFLFMGLLLSADVSKANPEANTRLGHLLEEIQA